jgi:hypothetical protein
VHCRFIGVVVPELRDRLGIERAKDIRRERVEFDLHEPAMPLDEASSAAIGFLARLRRERVLRDLRGGECDAALRPNSRYGR